MSARPRGPWAAVGGTALVKVLVLGLSGVLGIVTSRLILSHFGEAAYAQYGLISALPNLLPFADLGIGAAVVNAIAESADPRRDVVVRRTMTSALRILLCSGGVIAVVSVVLGVTGVWPAILGDDLLPGTGAVAMWSMVLFGLALPFTIGQRTLIGLGRNPAQIATQALVAPFIMLAVVVTLAAGWSGTVLPLWSYVAAALVSVLCFLIARRLLGPQLGASVRDVPRRRAVPGVRVMHVAGPMLVQMIALPIAMQTDRLLLSHLATTTELARYNLASQFFGIVLQTISAAGVALWPIFAKHRSTGTIRSPFAAMWAFTGAALLVAGVLCAVLPWLTAFVSDGRITLPWQLVVAFVAFVAVQAAKYPLGMYMTDAAGLRFQVPPILVLVPANLALSWALIGPLGAAGPVVGSTVTVLLCQVLPNVWYVRRDLRRRREAASAQDVLAETASTE
ncbi:lipopolysaccharide biosynthesis protein [Cellulomonas massiliensis]|uniref:lipopolysaccharide biosynthesis protein n=1 Tax=Cellulomonas massiliensis TaxID=1465811 RepID=UPI0004749858|nr:oligosaccharide flippase family protein [Cellulomonas massiliensis]